MTQPIDPRALIGHVHLKVSDVARSEEFYRRTLGFEVTARYGRDAVFMSAGGYHHHLGLNAWHSKGSPPGDPRAPGLFHFAVLYPDRRSLARAVKRVVDAGVAIDGAADHGVSEAVYLHDPDGNGIEIYRDRDPSEWGQGPDGTVGMVTEALDVRALIEEGEAAEAAEREADRTYLPTGVPT
jgi:catechol 2,3-dioxygenase